MDEFALAAFELPNRQQVWLLRYARNPFPGTTVLVDAAANVQDELGLITEALELGARDITWVAPDPVRLTAS
ncbi:MAG: hypothetical protein QM692_10990 [Thermomicrobiales bacterium]